MICVIINRIKSIIDNNDIYKEGNICQCKWVFVGMEKETIKSA